MIGITFLRNKTKYIIIWLKRQKNKELNLSVIGVLEMIFRMVVGEKIKRHGWLIRTIRERVHTMQF